MERLKAEIERYKYPLSFQSISAEKSTVLHFSKKGGLLCLIIKVLRALFIVWCDMPDRHIDRGWLMRLLYQPFSWVLCSANDWGEYGPQQANVIRKLKLEQVHKLRVETQKWAEEVLELLEETGASSQIKTDLCDNVKIII